MHNQDRTLIERRGVINMNCKLNIIIYFVLFLTNSAVVVL